MAISNITTNQQTVTATGAVTPTAGLDISGVTGNYTVHVRVQNLSSASGTPKATIQLEDSVNAFTASVPQAVVNLQGPISTNAEQHFVWQKNQLPGLRAGTASAVARINVTALGGTTPTMTLDAWLET